MEDDPMEKALKELVLRLEKTFVDLGDMRERVGNALHEFKVQTDDDDDLATVLLAGGKALLEFALAAEALATAIGGVILGCGKDDETFKKRFFSYMILYADLALHADAAGNIAIMSEFSTKQSDEAVSKMLGDVTKELTEYVASIKHRLAVCKESFFAEDEK